MNGKWTDEQVRAAVRDSVSISDVRRKLKAGEGGSAWRHLKSRIESSGADTSHFDPYSANRNRARIGFSGSRLVKTERIPHMRPVRDEYLSTRDYLCDGDGCGISEWMGKPIRLHMDHVDGDRSNNVPENLRLLCPNCHDQTETWGNQGKGASALRRMLSYCACGASKMPQSAACKTCAAKTRNRTKIEWAPLVDLEAMVADLGYSETGRRLGVSDVAVKKRISSERLKAETSRP